MSQHVLLKKYANRRLYDTHQSRYVTLQQVAQMIRAGSEVKVVDAKSEEDVTAFILTQIILDKARQSNALLPVSLLHLIVQYGENVLADFFDNHLEQTLKNYLACKSAADQQFKKWLEKGADFAEITPEPLSACNLFKSNSNLATYNPSIEEDKPK